MYPFRICGCTVEVYHYQVTYTEQAPGEEPAAVTVNVPTIEEAQAIAAQYDGTVSELDSSTCAWMDGLELPDVPEPYDEAVRIFEMGEEAYLEELSGTNDVMAMLVDQEYRLTLLELGVN